MYYNKTTSHTQYCYLYINIFILYLPKYFPPPQTDTAQHKTDIQYILFSQTYYIHASLTHTHTHTLYILTLTHSLFHLIPIFNHINCSLL